MKTARHPVFAAVEKILLLLFLFSSLELFGQEALQASTITMGAGGTPYTDYPSLPNFQTGGPAFTGNYEYRLFKYLAAEGGADILLPSGQHFGQVAMLAPGQNVVSYMPGLPVPTVLVSGRSRVTLLTYGLKGILPLASGRLELFAGVGGAYEWNSEGSYLNGAFAQASLGGRFAVDRGHRFWLGTTLRGFASFGPGRQAWVPLTFDLGIRLGH